MKRYVSYTFAAALALSTGLVSCGKTGSDDAQASFDIRVQNSGGCVDLAGFYSALNRMPNDGWVRRHTINMSADERNTRVSSVIENGGSPRPNFLSILYYSNFEITEQRVPEFQSELGQISQVGCSRVTIGSVDYAIRESSSDTIRIAHVVQIKDKSNPGSTVPFEKESITYRFRSPRSVDIIRKQLVQDPCPHYDTVFVTKTTRLAWGHMSDPAVDEAQEIDANYVRRAIRALYRVPETLNAIGTESTGLTRMSIADMTALRNSEVRRDMQACPYRAKPSEGDDPEAPIEVATPTPTPTPTPEATPED